MSAVTGQRSIGGWLAAVALGIGTPAGAASPPNEAMIAMPVELRATPSGSTGFPAAAIRVTRVARRLLTANTAACPAAHFDHGFLTGAARPLRLGVAIAAVLPGSPAAVAGLRAGDVVRTINGTSWSPDRGEAAAFAQMLADRGMNPRLALLIIREDGEYPVTLRGDSACRVTVQLNPAPSVNAAASDGAIVLDSGLERLLPDDNELAFALAHELAHIVLGHTAPDQRGAVADRTRRPHLEAAADATAVRLMAAAGFAPAAAAPAFAKVADAGRGPLARLMDLHGPYMPTTERTAFLNSEAARWRVPPSPAQLQR